MSLSRLAIYASLVMILTASVSVSHAQTRVGPDGRVIQSSDDNRVSLPGTRPTLSATTNTAPELRIIDPGSGATLPPASFCARSQSRFQVRNFSFQRYSVSQDSELELSLRCMGETPMGQRIEVTLHRDLSPDRYGSYRDEFAVAQDRNMMAEMRGDIALDSFPPVPVLPQDRSPLNSSESPLLSQPIVAIYDAVGIPVSLSAGTLSLEPHAQRVLETAYPMMMRLPMFPMPEAVRLGMRWETSYDVELMPSVRYQVNATLRVATALDDDGLIRVDLSGTSQMGEMQQVEAILRYDPATGAIRHLIVRNVYRVGAFTQHMHALR